MSRLGTILVGPERGRLRAYLELVRVPLTPTAVADSFAGFCLVASWFGKGTSAWTLAPVAAASILLYWMGMVTNDIFDRERDRARHPGRPLPRGAVRPAEAALLAIVLGAVAVGAAWSVSAAAASVAGLLSMLILAYNTGGKWIPVGGNLLMGSCRAANLFLGAIAAAGTRDRLNRFVGSIAFEWVWMAAAVLGVYIACVTAVSLLEDHPHRKASFVAATAPLLLIPAALAGLGHWGCGAMLNAGALACLLASGIARGFGTAAIPPAGLTGTSFPAGHPAEGFVRDGLLGVFLVDAGFLFAAGLHRPALAEYGLLILAWLWRRRCIQSLP